MNTWINGYWCDPAAGLIFGKRAKRAIGCFNGGGYIQIRASNGTSWMMAHRMIWESVHGPIPAGLEINHINGVKHDNRIANLELVTPSENTLHAYRTGLASHVGERNSRAKLTAAKVVGIRSSSESLSAMARTHEVSRRTIRDVISRKSWSHVA